MLAVIETGGKQYIVKKDDLILVNKIKGEVESNVLFDKVLLFFDGQKLLIGKPFLDNIKVKGKIVKQIKKKIQIIKFKPKTRYKKKVGYKNYFTQIKIEDFILS
jgi:large subunit ribosomal protein L21